MINIMVTEEYQVFEFQSNGNSKIWNISKTANGRTKELTISEWRGGGGAVPMWSTV